ncbi:LysR family transcriptional regulator [Saccharopolyspora erythraea NRRL 2338]|uniref:LysR substrate-binding domain-containing protein n=1 Tax=Saccharopolyspora erythraea TaxID=1836 RepID=A0ABN1CAN4_SACER|nr:LysR family transcriptional regulator [Saccharopolyspora erythraea D]PFG96967.1 LysR family transcriptional regulator [Saccharopolyspora erythraea NRRL 2338]
MVHGTARARGADYSSGVELHQVEYFLAVVDHGGINAAAVALQLAQPTVSQAIRTLERELGAQLFHRAGRGMVLTSAGAAFVGPARQILRDVVTAEGALVDADGLPRGRLDVYAAPALAVDPVAHLVGAYRQRYPNVSVRLGDFSDEDACAALIREGHCELVICHLPVSSGGLEVRELGSREYWLVFPPGVDAPEQDPLPLAELPDVPLVAVPRGASQRTHIERALSAAGRRTRASAVVQHREALVPFVLAGVGATMLQRSVAERAAARGAVVRAVDPPLNRAYGLVYDPALLSPAGRAFLELAGRG